MGKGKNNPLNIYCTPADVQAKADERHERENVR